MSMLAWVHLQIRHMGSNVLGKLCLLPSGSSMSHHPALPASFTWQLQLLQKVDHQGLPQEQTLPVLLCSLPVSPAEDTTDEMGGPEETHALKYFFASRAASAKHTFVQIVAADLPPCSILPLRNRVQPVSCCQARGAAVMGGRMGYTQKWYLVLQV